MLPPPQTANAMDGEEQPDSHAAGISRYNLHRIAIGRSPSWLSSFSR
jgi:hypothetical protein